MTEPTLISQAQLDQARKNEITLGRLREKVKMFRSWSVQAEAQARLAPDLWRSGFDDGRAQAYDLAAEFIEKVMQ